MQPLLCCEEAEKEKENVLKKAEMEKELIILQNARKMKAKTFRMILSPNAPGFLYRKYRSCKSPDIKFYAAKSQSLQKNQHTSILVSGYVDFFSIIKSRTVKNKMTISGPRTRPFIPNTLSPPRIAKKITSGCT